MAGPQSTEWERMTVGHLKGLLNALTSEGDVNDDTLIVVDSDPEGNGLHPVRQAYALGTLSFGRSGQIEDFVDDEAKATPAATLWLGVGY